MLGTAAAIGAAALPGFASAGTHIGFTLHATFKCSSLPTCPKFTATGSGGGYSTRVTGTVQSENAQGCALQTERWTLSSGSSKLYMKSTYDKVCRAGGPTTYHETGKLVVTSGTGKYSGAQGTAGVSFVEHLQPPTIQGPVNITLTRR